MEGGREGGFQALERDCTCFKPRLHEPFIAGSARVQRVLKCLHMSHSARFCTILWITQEYQI